MIRQRDCAEGCLGRRQRGWEPALQGNELRRRTASEPGCVAHNGLFNGEQHLQSTLPLYV